MRPVIFCVIIFLMFIKIIQILVVFFNLILGYFVLSRDVKSPNNRIFALMTIMASLWTVANYMDNISVSSVWLQTSYALGVLVISIGLIWTLSITHTKIGKKEYLILASFTLFFCIGSYIPNFIILSFKKISTEAIPFGYPGWGLMLYSVFYLIEAFLIIWILRRAMVSADVEQFRNSFRNIYHGAIITLAVTLFSSFILPFFLIFPFGGLDNIGFLIFLLFIVHSITRYDLFNLRVIVVELVIFCLWAFLIMRIVLAGSTREMLTESSIFMIAFILGIIFIQTVFQNIKQRDEIANLSKKLEESYEFSKISKKPLI